MTPSPRIIQFIQGYEKLRLKSYMPTPNDKPTIGWGTTGSDITLGMEWTIEQANERFAHDLAGFASGVEMVLGHATATQDQFDAMVSLAYNIGLANFRTSSVMTNHKAGHYSTAAMAFILWNKQRDKKTGQLVILNGLTSRRQAESLIYQSLI